MRLLGNKHTPGLALEGYYDPQHKPHVGVTRESSGRCTSAGDSDGDILPGFKLREFGSTEADQAYIKRWGYE